MTEDQHARKHSGGLALDDGEPVDSTEGGPPDPGGPAPERPLPAERYSARSALQRIGELAAALVVAALVSLVVQWISVRLSLPEPSFAKLEVTLLVAAVVLAGLAGLAAMSARSARGPGWSGWKSIGAWAGLATLSTSALSVPLHGTRWYLGGLSGDNLFRIPYFTHMTASVKPVDMTYKDVPSFYSVGWFWTGGRFAELTGTQGWAAYKYFAILTMAVVPALAFSLWSLTVTRRVALLLGTVTALAGIAPATLAWEPYAWAVYALAPPVAVLMGRALRSPASATGATDAESADAARRRWILAGAGVFIGIAGDVYALIGGVLALLAIGYGVVALLPRRVSPPLHGIRSLPRRTVLLRIAAMGAAAVAVMLPVWGAYLAKSLSAGMPPNPAQDFLPETSAQFSLPMFEPTLSGAFFLFGVAWLVVSARRDPIAAGLAALAASAVAWHVLSVLALLKSTSLLSYSANVILYPTLYCAGALGAVDLAAWAWRHHRRVLERAHPMLATGIAVLAAVSVVQRGESEISGWVDKAYATTTPSGTAADGITVDHPHSASYLDNQIRAATGRAPQDTVVLNAPISLSAEFPYWNFQAIIPQYSNPLADYDARNAEITKWSTAKTPAELLKDLDTSKFTPPTVFFFAVKDDGWHSWLEVNQHLNTPEHVGHDVVFDPKAFDAAEFRQWRNGSDVIVVRR